MAEEFEEQEQVQKQKATSFRTSYWAIQEADLQAERDMEKALELASASFLDYDATAADIYATVIGAMQVTQTFLYKYELEDSQLLKQINDIIIDAANGVELDYLRSTHEEIRAQCLRKALQLGFGRPPIPQYPWEYKMAMQAQVPLTPELNHFLFKSSRKSGSSSSSLITPSGRRRLRSIGTHRSSSQGTTAKEKQR